MTVLIVAILGGRTKEEWYSQITDRVKQNYGYKTPTTVPQVYEQSRLNAFKVGQEARKAHQKAPERLGLVMCRARLGLGFSRLRLAKTQARPSAEGWAWLGLGRAQARAYVPKE